MSDNYNGILGKKLKSTREKFGLTLQEVSSQMGFKNYQTLSAMEEGKRQVKALELSQLSKIYYKDIAFFLNPTEEIEIEPMILWRSKNINKGMKEKERVFLQYCNSYCDIENKLGIDNRFKLPPVDPGTIKPEDFNYDTVNEIVKNYYNLMQLGPRPACVLENVLEEKYNTKILYLSLENCGSAASAIGAFGAAILINSSEAPWRRNFDLAHELFHLITWKVFENEKIHIVENEKSPIEKWANYFASNLLMPQDEIDSECRKRTKDAKLSIIDLVGVAKEFKVSTSALMWRLVNLKLINREETQNVISSGALREKDIQEKSQSDWGKEPQAISERYVNLLFKAYQKGMFSKGKVAQYLDVNISDVKYKFLEYGYNEQELHEKDLAFT